MVWPISQEFYFLTEVFQEASDWPSIHKGRFLEAALVVVISVVLRRLTGKS
jgi:hypothetical protein